MAVFDPRNSAYAGGAKVDAQQVFDAVTTPSGTHITSASGKFAPGDVGKVIWVTTPNGAVIPQTTIASYVSPTEVVASSGASLSLAGSGQSCVWGTDDTAAYVAAYNAAVSLTVQNDVLVPSGQSIITSRIYNCTGGIPPNLIGETASYSVLLVSPNLTMPGDGSGPLINAHVGGASIKGMTIWGPSSMYTPALSNQSLIDCSGSYFDLSDIQMLDFGSTDATMNFLRIRNCSNLRMDRVQHYTTFGTANGSQMTGTLLSNVSGNVYGHYSSNIYRSMCVQNFHWRDGIGVGGSVLGLNFWGGGFDECSAPGNFDIINAEVNIHGMGLWVAVTGGHPSYAVRVDGTSKLWIDTSSMGPYPAGDRGNTYGGLQVLSGGEVRSLDGNTYHCSSLSGNVSVDNQVGSRFYSSRTDEFKNAGAGGAGVIVPWSTAFSNLSAVIRL